MVETDQIDQSGNNNIRWDIPDDGSREVIAAIDQDTELLIGTYQ